MSTMNLSELMILKLQKIHRKKPVPYCDFTIERKQKISESNRLYRQTEQGKEARKKYDILNQEHRIQYHKTYYQTENAKEARKLKYRSSLVLCSCNRMYSTVNNNKQKHLSSKFHQDNKK